MWSQSTKKQKRTKSKLCFRFLKNKNTTKTRMKCARLEFCVCLHKKNEKHESRKRFFVSKVEHDKLFGVLPKTKAHAKNCERDFRLKLSQSIDCTWNLMTKSKEIHVI